MLATKEKYFSICLYFLWTLYCLNFYIFERVFYINEILSFFGFFLFMFKSFRDKKFIIPNSGLYKYMLWFMLLCGIHLIISLFRLTNLYYYLRNSVILYSAFTFFIGFYLFDYFLPFLNKIRWILLIFLMYAFIFPDFPGLLDRQNVAVLFPFLWQGNKKTVYIFFAIAILAYVASYTALTVFIVGVAVLAVMHLKYLRHLQLAFLAGLIFIVGFSVYFSPNINLYKTGPYNMFGNLDAVYSTNPIFRIDQNSSWRLVYWYRVITEKYPENLVGIGFGTPLLPYKPGYKTIDSSYNDEHDSHVMGVHNTFLTLFIRLGIPFLVLMYLIYGIVLKDFFTYKMFHIQQNYYKIFMAFFVISVISLFNLVLESPTCAAVFWVLLGLLAQAIERRKLENLSLIN
jgi:hypothetical protein